jgi:hypothetical protein
MYVNQMTDAQLIARINGLSEMLRVEYRSLTWTYSGHLSPSHCSRNRRRTRVRWRTNPCVLQVCYGTR